MIVITYIFSMVIPGIVTALTAGVTVTTITVWFLMVVRKRMSTYLKSGMPPVRVPMVSPSMRTIIMGMMKVPIMVMVGIWVMGWGSVMMRGGVMMRGTMMSWSCMVLIMLTTVSVLPNMLLNMLPNMFSGFSPRGMTMSI